jgi:AraC family transcriptional regulator of arabinose operon
MYRRLKAEQPSFLSKAPQQAECLMASCVDINAVKSADRFLDQDNGMKGYRLYLILDGQGEVIGGDKALYCQSGDILIVPPHVQFRCKPAVGNWRYRWIYFYPRCDWSKWLTWHSREQALGKISLTPAILAEFDDIFAEIETILLSGRRISDALALNLLERLLLRITEEDPLSPQRINEPRVADACRYIIEHLTEELRIEEIAEVVGLSPSRLAHLFREQIGISILRWREEQRMVRAKRLLQSTRLAIAEISQRIGYEDQLYFSRVFRKRFGVSPSDFRRRCSEFYGNDSAENAIFVDEAL